MLHATRLAALIATLCAALSVAVANAADRVAVRVGEHPGFSRLVFDWGGPVGVKLTQSPGQATVQFDRPGDIDLKPYKSDPPPEISAVAATEAPSGTAVVVTMVEGATARLLEVDGVVVIDVLRAGTPADAAPAKPGAKQAKTAEPPKPASKPVEAAGQAIAKTEAKASSGPVPRRKPVPSPAPADPAATPPPVPVEQVVSVPIPGPPGSPDSAVGGGPIPLLPPTGFDPSAAEPAPAKPEATEGAKEQAPGNTESASAVVEDPVPVPKGRPLRRLPPPKPAIPEKAAESAPATASTDVKPAKPRTQVSTSGPAILIDTAAAPARSVDRGMAVPLRFEWPEEVAAAAYRRGASLWLAFDHTPPRDLTVELTRLVPQFGPYEQHTVAGGTLIRMGAPPVLVPALRKDGTAWIVDLWSADHPQTEEIAAVADGGAQPPEVSFALPNAGRLLSFEDPELGDRIMVVPVTRPGHGLPQSREFPQFRVLRSYQGLAILPFSDSLEVAVADDKTRVRDSSGLVLSHGSNLALLKSNIQAAPTGPRLLDPETWRRGGPDEFLARKQTLQSAVSNATPEALSIARMALAQFYFGHGLSAETLGVLRLNDADDPRLAMDPRSRLMKGASAFLVDDFDNAAKDIFDPSLEGEWEAQLWHAAFASASHDWEMAARGFARTEELMPAYPHAVRTRLRLLAAEANLGIGDTLAANRYLTQIREDSPTHAEEAQVAVLVGRRRHLEGNIDDAFAIWQRVLTSRHPPSQTRARVALLDLGIETGSVTPEQAVQELERLRFAWRGDRFEFALLQRLGDLYISLGDYRAGLRALRQAASYFPGSERAQSVAQRMRDIFVDLYLGSASADLPPLRALAMYEEFKELTPPGEHGDQVIANLADRLVDVDLLDRAAELLTAQIRYRLEGEAKARAGARLAMIRLLDRSPGKAIEAIELSDHSGLPIELERERRHLRVRALSQLGHYESALNELGKDDDRAALRLRADILWAQRDWPAAALALERLLPPAPTGDAALSDADGQAVMDMAIALTLADQRDKLRTLDKTYGEAMKSKPSAPTYAMLVGDGQPGQTKSIAEELSQVAEVEAFLTSYRDRLQQQRAAVQ